MPRNIRYLLFVVYSLVAVAAPLFAFLFPGQPALQINVNVIDVQGSQLPEPQRVLDSGAENYQQNVLHDLDGHLASVAADYPDGSSVLFARFSSPFNAEKAGARLKKMIPHVLDEEKDLWSVYFTSDSGEYVQLSRQEQFLVLIIADREALARQRLENLPALLFNSNPGVGAVLGLRSTAELMMLLLFYVFLQSLLIANLKRWSTAAKDVSQDNNKPTE
ncbi:hypothetical protein ACFL2V_09960 [Pseudomonadota bacterium]